MAKEKRSFFDRLTGATSASDYDDSEENSSERENSDTDERLKKSADWLEESADDGELTVDVYQTADDIIIKTMVAGVRPEDLDISITRDMVTIKGTRETVKDIQEDNYFHRELYWGTFSRAILLPQEIEVDEAEAVEKHGLLVIKLPKIVKGRQTKLRVKSSA